MSLLRYHDAMSLDSARRRFFFLDDFLGDQLQDLWREVIVGAGTLAVVDSQTGGVLRFTTGAVTGDRITLDWNHTYSLLVSKNVDIEFRLKMNTLTTVSNFVEIHNVAGNRIGFTTGAVNWQIRTIDVGSTSFTSGIAVTANYVTLRMECKPTAIHFFIDGVETANSPITTDIPTVHLQPRIRFSITANVARGFDLDYIVISQER